jgi:uncharacterized protein (TIGR02268 family)
MRTARLLLATLSVISIGSAHAAPKQAHATRELRRRTLTLDDASVTMLPEIHVAGGTATVLTFTIPLEEGGAIPGAVKDYFYQLGQMGDRTLILVPKKDLTEPVPLNISLKDGTVITFKCLSVVRDSDAQVDVVLALKSRAPVESVSALKNRLGQLQSDLDACRTTAGDAGAGKVANLLLAQSLDTPQVFDRRPLRKAEKQHRLLVEARWAYRLLGLTYIIFTVENRDPDRNWVLDRAEVRTSANKTAADIAVKAVLAELPSLPPEGAERVVVAFPTPPGAPTQEISVTLHEKDGGRSATIEGLQL